MKNESIKVPVEFRFDINEIEKLIVSDLEKGLNKITVDGISQANRVFKEMKSLAEEFKKIEIEATKTNDQKFEAIRKYFEAHVKSYIKAELEKFKPIHELSAADYYETTQEQIEAIKKDIKDSELYIKTMIGQKMEDFKELIRKYSVINSKENEEKL